MARKIKNTPVPEPEEIPIDDGVVDRQQEFSAPSGRKSKIVLKMDENGLILWDEVSDSNKQKFAASVSSDPIALEMIGLAAEGGGLADGSGGLPLGPPPISEKNVAMVLDTLAWVQGLVFTKALKFDSDISKEVCKFTPEEHKDLDEMGARIANKHAPELLKKYQDEIFFAGMLAFTMSLQLQRARQMQKDRNEQKVAAEVSKSKRPIGEVLAMPSSDVQQ